MNYNIKKIISFSLFFMGIIISLIGVSYSYALDINNIEQSGEVNTIQTIKENIVKIKLSFIGDSLLASFKGEKYSGNFQDLLDNNSYSFPYKNVSKIFKEDDIAFFNIANPIWFLTNGEIEVLSTYGIFYI